MTIEQTALATLPLTEKHEGVRTVEMHGIFLEGTTKSEVWSRSPVCFPDGYQVYETQTGHHQGSILLFPLHEFSYEVQRTYEYLIR